MESLVNTVFGMIIATVGTQVICWYYDINLPIGDNLIITFWLTVLSLVRQFGIRRLFNKLSERFL